MMTVHTVRQLLEVFRLFREGFLDGVPLRKSYTRAVREVAGRYSVTYQTIGDGCRRRLELQDINDLYQLLSTWMNGDPRPLLKQIKDHSIRASHSEIAEFFAGELSEASRTHDAAEDRHDQSVTFSFRLPSANARLLRALAQLEGKSVGEVTSSIICESMKVRMKELLRNIESTMKE